MKKKQTKKSATSCGSTAMNCYGFSLNSVIAERARPTDLRKSMQVVDEFCKAGILFVPIPVLNKKDGGELCTESFKRLATLERKASLEA